MNRKVCIWITIYFTGMVYTAGAQYQSPVLPDSASADTANAEERILEAGSFYNGRAHLWGRDFEEKQAGIGVYAKYNAPKGVYLYASTEYWTGDPAGLSFTDIGIGYEREISDRLSAAIGYNRWLFHQEDAYTKHALENSLEAGIGYDIKGFNLEPSVGVLFGIEKVFFAGLAANRNFTIAKTPKTTYTLNPVVEAIFANRDFILIYGDYPEGFLNDSRFSMVDTEISLPFNLTSKNIKASLALHYNVPVRITGETTKPLLYISAGFTYNFRL